MATPDEKSQMILKATFRHRFFFTGKRPNLKRNTFKDWAASQTPPISIIEKDYTALREGKPLPAHKMEAFLGYIKHFEFLDADLKTDFYYSIESIAMPFEHGLDDYITEDITFAETNPNHVAKYPRDGFFQFPIHRILHLLFHIKSLPDEAFCHGPDDYLLVANWMLYSVGYGELEEAARNNEIEYSRKECIRCGQDVMNRTPEKYADHIAMSCSVNKHAVIFTTEKGRGGRRKRVAVSGFLPLTRAAFQRFRDGKVEDIDIQRTDLRPRSPFLYLNILAEDPDEDKRRSPENPSANQINTIFYQGAMLCVPLDSNPINPVIITVPGTPKTEIRAQSHGYQRVGTVMPTSKRAIFEIAPPTGPNRNDKAWKRRYRSVIFGIQGYQDIQS